MTFDTFLDNLLPWMAQVFIIAAVGALLPVLFRIRHPRTQLIYCHLVLAVCVAVPVLQPWRRPIVVIGPADESATTSPVQQPHKATEVKPIPVIPTPATQATAPLKQPLIAIELFSRRTILWILAIGAVVRLGWLVGGLWQIRRYRIASTPLYPIPESVQAASAITHADAIFCISSDVPGPVMPGWLAPVVLLPESFLALGEEAQCGVVCHELLHVRRHDWLITVLEELVAALFWFNPPVWYLLWQTRLAREQLVDGEVVRLTASKEPYIDALLSIARGRPILDLAPAPLFLRRRHLTQRMHLLLKEVSMSRLRLVSSYFSITAILGFAGWFALASFPLIGHPQIQAATPRPAPVERSEPVRMIAQVQTPAIRPTTPSKVSPTPIPGDPHELVSGAVQIAASPAERAAALSLLERAVQNNKLHMPGTPPYKFTASFSAGGSSTNTGGGEVTETWLSGQSWRWTANIGNYSVVRIGSRGQTVEEKHVSMIPMPVQMLRNAIFWAAPGRNFSNAQIRTAAVRWNNKPATCVLVSGVVGAAVQARLWEEEEFCIDNASGILQIHSIAPGTVTVYGYTGDLQFHGRSIPDRITIYVAGIAKVDAQFNITDAGFVDQSLLTPTPEMIANGPVIVSMSPVRFPLDVPLSSSSGAIQSVIIHAEIDGDGNVIEAELSAASNPALAQPALDFVKKERFPAAGLTQRQAYINVRFVPASQ